MLLGRYTRRAERSFNKGTVSRQELNTICDKYGTKNIYPHLQTALLALIAGECHCRWGLLVSPPVCTPSYQLPHSLRKTRYYGCSLGKGMSEYDPLTKWEYLTEHDSNSLAFRKLLIECSGGFSVYDINEMREVSNSSSDLLIKPSQALPSPVRIVKINRQVV